MIRRFVQFGTEDQVNILDLAQKTWNLQDLNFLHFESETEVWNQDPVEFFQQDLEALQVFLVKSVHSQRGSG